MPTKIDLDELERKARAATGGEWKAEIVTGMPRDNEPIMAMVVSDGVQQIADCYDNTPCSDKQSEANAQHVAANGPPVTLALIARIRELEAALDSAIHTWNRSDEFDTHEAFRGDMLVILEKGAVLP